MVQLKKDISINLNKLIEFIFPKKEKYINEKVIFYIRIYTDLVKAEDNMTFSGYNRMINLLKIVRNMAKSQDFREEEPYLKRIKSITDEIMGKAAKIKRDLKKPNVYDPMHAKTKLQLAQNICILRILKREA